jgi:hypothetical protein
VSAKKTPIATQTIATPVGTQRLAIESGISAIHPRPGYVIVGAALCGLWSRSPHCQPLIAVAMTKILIGTYAQFYWTLVDAP